MDSFHCLCLLSLLPPLFHILQLAATLLFPPFPGYDRYGPPCAFPPVFVTQHPPLPSTDKLLPASANPLQTPSYPVVNVKTHPRAPNVTPGYAIRSDTHYHGTVISCHLHFMLTVFPAMKTIPANKTSIVCSRSISAVCCFFCFFKKTHHLLKEMQCWTQ